MSRGGGGGRGGGRGGRGASSFIVQSYRNMMGGEKGSMGAGFGSAGAEDGAELYPQLARRPAPPAVVKDLKFMVAAKRDLETRFAAVAALDVGQRWRLLSPNLAHFPAELDWRRRKRRLATTAAAAKRPRRLSASLLDVVPEADADDADPEATAKAKATATAAAGSDAEDEEEGEGERFENDEELEDNDYVDAYFDNGEGFGAEDGEEEPEGESWYY